MNCKSIPFLRIIVTVFLMKDLLVADSKAFHQEAKRAQVGGLQRLLLTGMALISMTLQNGLAPVAFVNTGALGPCC